MGSSNIKRCIAGFLSFFASMLFASEISVTGEDNWVFSGIVNNDKGDQYAYFFQIEQQADVLKSAVVMIDMQSNQPIFEEEAQEMVSAHALNHWEVGSAFLDFNPITGSWVFGLRTKEKEGFNFKIDMMNLDSTTVLEERLRPGLKVSLNQVKALNGHIYLSKKPDQFVTARYAWMRKITISPQTIQRGPHFLSGLLCHFDDDSGFYSVKLPDVDALQGALAGRFDGQGQMHPMSQFIQVEKTAAGVWSIESVLPQYHFVLSHLVELRLMTVGLIEQQQKHGACLVSQNTYTL
jgi:hypothetical protein